MSNMISKNGNLPSNSEAGTQLMRPQQQQFVIARPVQPGPAPASGPTLDSGFNALRRHWKLGIPLGIVLAALGATAGWFLMVPKYSASAFLRINSDDRPLIFETADAASSNAASFKLYKSTQSQMLLTPFVLNAALRKPGIAELEEIRNTRDPVVFLQENLEIDFPADGEIMRIAIETPSSAACVKLVNAVVEAYMDEVVVHERNGRLDRLNNLQTVYKETESKVRNKRGELKTLASALGTSDAESLTVAQQSALQQFGHMQEKLSTIQFQLMQAEGDLKISQTIEQQIKGEQTIDAVTNTPEPSLALPVLESDLRTSAVVGLESEVATLKSRLLSMQETSGSGHPSVRRLQQELALKQELLTTYQNDARTQAEERAAERSRAAAIGPTDRSSPLSPFSQLELSTRIEILRNQETILKEKVDQLAAETRQLGKSSIDVELMRAEIEGQEAVLRNVGGEIEKTSIELKTASRIQSISPAEKAISPDIKKRLAATGGLGMLGLLAPLGLLIGWDLSRRKVDGAASANKTLSMSSLGAIPYIDYDPLHPSPRCGSRETRQRSVLSESVDSLAAMVTHRCQVDDAQTFMITSAIASEGKSTVSCQLADSLSRAGKQVVLVDFDLRRPAIHEYLQLNRAPGVCDMLFNDASLLEVVQISKQHKLSVITAGEGWANINEMAVSGKLERLLEQLRERYDVVIIDACPVLPVVDARIIGKYVDGVILTLLRDRSRLPLVAEACEMLKAYGVNLMGTILIGGAKTSYSGYYQDSSYLAGKASARIPQASPK